ncbi:TetR/AcrR family transcriptional regulator C-terminal domain-containing protein [Tepidicaulis sp. LMO-SS28]|uniref:TetR/AcrR family transcriptional regulator C-terminal domain-containing protein n=1 Tax=Tepidicaulis sp. LMO-SS28 TaxID=3447455 RepID=UPI003EE36127
MALARWLQCASSTPEFLGFYRLCVSEARRFPAVARFGYTSISYGLIKPYEVVFSTFEAEQRLRILDAEVAAEQFFDAVVGACLWSQALGAPLPEKHVSEQHLRQVVDMFLRIPPQTTTLEP